MTDITRDQHKAKVSNIIVLLKRLTGEEGPKKILIVGSGDGIEAKSISEGFAAETVAIDLKSSREVDCQNNVDFRVMDARDMTFEDGQFDLVYSYHVLEHIINDKLALAEMARVLTVGGTFFIGTPNKQRIIAYYKSAPSIRKAIVWNIADWRARFRGRFANEYGAHAGYTLGQLLRRCENAFGQAIGITDDYYVLNYPNHSKVLKLLSSSGLWRLVYPSVYVFGKKVSRK